MGYQRSRQTFTVATVEIAAASTFTNKDSCQSLLKGGVTVGPSPETVGIGVAVDKQNAAVPMAGHGSGRRYPLRDRNTQENGVLFVKKIEENVNSPGSLPSKARSCQSKSKRVREQGSTPKDGTASRKRKRLQFVGTPKENRAVVVDCNNQKPSQEVSDAAQEGFHKGECPALAVVEKPLVNALNFLPNDEIDGRPTQYLEEKENVLGDEHDDPPTTASISGMLEMYSKLHLKYKKLKERKFREVEEYAGEQKRCFTAYVKAQEDLVQHLRNDNNRLMLLVDQGTVSRTLNRSMLLDQENAECRNNLLLEQAKNLELSMEVKKLHLLLSEAMARIRQDENINGPCQHNSAVCFRAVGQNTYSGEKSALIPSNNQSYIVDLSQVLSPPLRVKSPSNPTSEHVAAVRTEEIQNKAEACGLDSRGNVGKRSCSLLASVITGQAASDNVEVGFDNTDNQMDNHFRNDAAKGETTNLGVVSLNSLFQMLLQHMIGFTVTIPEGVQSSQLSFLHQSSGYSFKLKYLYPENNPNKEDGELLYNLVSLGTLQKVAPDWMKEEMIFSIAQVNIFFGRLLEVANGHGCRLVIRS